MHFACKATVLLFFFLCLTASVMFKFVDQQTVRRVVRALPPVGVGTYYGIPQTRYACFGLFVCLLVGCLFVCLFIGWLLMWTSFSGRHHYTLLASCSKNPPWRIVGRKEKCPIFSISCSLTQSPVSRLSSSNPRVFFLWLKSTSGLRKRMPLSSRDQYSSRRETSEIGTPKNYTMIAKLYRGLYRV